jgi:ATP-dependent exoDNAse (exonuclease V) alpha subunit
LIIDETGMAETLSLDAAVRFAIDRGASVRRVDDDQQLAAIGAGGVLRNIKQTHGAPYLAELHRFTNPSGRLVAPRTVSLEGWPRRARPAELRSVESILG